MFGGSSSASGPTSFGSGSVFVSTTQSRAVFGDTATTSACVQPVTSVITQSSDNIFKSSGNQSSLLDSDRVNDTSSDSNVTSDPSETVTPSKRAPRYRCSPGKEMIYDIRNTAEENIAAQDIGIRDKNNPCYRSLTQ